MPVRPHGLAWFDRSRMLLGALGFGTDMAIDLGTANTCVFAPGRGIVLNEPSIVAYNTEAQAKSRPSAEAYEMIGRTPPHLVAIRPMKRRGDRGLRGRREDAGGLRPQANRRTAGCVRDW